LPSEIGLELLRATTGFDPATAFSDARNALLGVLKQLDSLPGSVPSKLWSLLGSMNEQANKVFRDGVKALAVEDAEQRREAVVKLISGTAFDDEPIGQWLTAVAASGLHALRLRQEIHSKAREAIASKYEFDFAYNYQKTTIKNALVDVVFDFSRQSARDLFRDVVVESNLDRLLVVKTDGVRLNQAVLTHQIDRKGVVQVTLP